MMVTHTYGASSDSRLASQGGGVAEVGREPVFGGEDVWPYFVNPGCVQLRAASRTPHAGQAQARGHDYCRDKSHVGVTGLVDPQKPIPGIHEEGGDVAPPSVRNGIG